MVQMPPGTSRNVAESSIDRDLTAGRIERVSAGTYRLAPFKPPPPPVPIDPAVAGVAAVDGFTYVDPLGRDVLSEDEWNAVLDAYHETNAWDCAKLGPDPDSDGSHAPYDLVLKSRDRTSKKREREAERQERTARQRQADDTLRSELLAAAQGNYVLGDGLDDMAPVKAILEIMPLDDLLCVIRAKVDKRGFPGNPPMKSWRDRVFLQTVAEWHCRRLAKNMVAAWSAAGNAPMKAADAPTSRPLPKT
jgi:hypothetical protein